MKEDIRKIRLEDAKLREGREDPKRVYLCVNKTSKEVWVEIVFVKINKETEKRFDFLKGVLGRLNKEGVAVPAVEGTEKTEDELKLKVSYEGRELLGQLESEEISGEIDLSQVAKIFKKMDQIDRERGEFILPRPIEKFFEVIEPDEFKEEHKAKITQSLQGLQCRFRSFLDSFASEYQYGWGVIDPDIINFTAKRGAGDGDYKVSLIDIDGLKESYDFYYQAGYFWTSLERLSNKRLIETKREEFESGLNFEREDARKRYQLGKAAAMSIVLFSKPKQLDQDELEGRIKAIEAVLGEAQQP